jgi:ABC-type transport system substrate-binding protein
MSSPVMLALVVAFTVLGYGSPTFAQPSSAPRGELRVVDRSPANWIWITLNVMEHLMELDKDGQLVPRLATGWSWIDDRTLDVNLRRGVKFHNGEVFDAEIVKLNDEPDLRGDLDHQPALVAPERDQEEVRRS